MPCTPAVRQDPLGLGGAERRRARTAHEPRGPLHQGGVGGLRHGAAVLADGEQRVQAHLARGERGGDAGQRTLTPGQWRRDGENGEEARPERPQRDARAGSEHMAPGGQHDAEHGEHRGSQQPYVESGARFALVGGSHGRAIIALGPPAAHGRSTSSRGCRSAPFGSDEGS